MTEELQIEARLRDLAEQSYNKGIYTYSHFLNVSEQESYYKLQRELRYAAPELSHIRDDDERRIVRFGSEETLGYSELYPVSILLVKPLSEKFSDELTHRDFLGALMNLGIERDTVGDILIRPGACAVFCLLSVKETIMTELTRVRHTSVCVSETDVEALSAAGFRTEFETIKASAASLRADCVVAQVCKLSRGAAQELFRVLYVTLNGRVLEKCDTELKQGDIFTVRGHGKFIFDGEDGTSKKGRTWITVRKYK